MPGETTAPQSRRDFLALTTGWSLCGLPLAAWDLAGIDASKGELLYQSRMDGPASVAGWAMEGPGEVSFANDWMTMWSPREKMHHVYWCPKVVPASFLAEWQSQNLHLEAGLCIVFFCATGLRGEDVLDPALPARDGTFSQYHSAELKNYHISYYANTPATPDRPVSRLRRNPGKHIVQEGPRGIRVTSDAVHHLRLFKSGGRILFFVDDRKIIDWTDPQPYGAGRIALRQMQWTRFRYRHFRVWGLKENI